MSGRTIRSLGGIGATSLSRSLRAVTACLVLLATTVPAWSQRTAEPVLRLETGMHQSVIRRLDVDPARNLLVTASDDKTARVWDLDTGQLRHVLRPPIGSGDIGQMRAVAIHPRDDLVAIGGTTGAGDDGRRIYLFSPSSGRMVRTFVASGDGVRRLRWSADGTVLVAALAGGAGNAGIRVIDAASGGSLLDEEVTGGCHGLATDARGNVAAACQDGRIRIYRATGGKASKVAEFDVEKAQPYSVAFSPEGQRLAVGFFADTRAPVVIDATSGRELARLDRPGFEAGNLWSVVWSSDGATVIAAGTGYQKGAQFPVVRYDAATGRLLGQTVVAGNSVMDLAAMGDGRSIYATAEGAWGVLDAAGKAGPKIGGTFGFVSDPTVLKADGTLAAIGWATADARQHAFDLRKRLASNSPASKLAEPKTRRGLFENAKWQDTTNPTVNGASIQLPALVASRSLAYTGSGDAFLGTSRELYRVNQGGRVEWQVPAGAEVRAAHASEDGRLVVTAQSDGTMRWWRGSDGQTLATLYVASDGRWVVWTPSGHFDASPGADRLLGWSVNRGPDEPAEFHSIGRFRDRFNRPDVIDRVFATLDVGTAVRDSDRAREAAIRQSEAEKPSLPELPTTVYLDATAPASTAVATPTPSAPPAAPPAAPPVATTPVRTEPIRADSLPPALGALDNAPIRTGGNEVSIPFTIRSQSSGAQIAIEIRVDGRPVERGSVDLPERFDGKTRALAKVNLPEGAQSVQIIATDRYGISDPLIYKVESPGAAVTTAIAKPIDAASIVASPIVAAAAPSTLPTRPPAAGGASSATGARQRAQGTLYVLSIGISNYQRAEYKLGLAAKDARDFSAALKAQEGKRFEQVVARTLSERDATRTEILAALKWLSTSVGPRDYGMLFMAGHGINAADGQYYFLPFEGQHERLAATGVPEAFIRQTLGTMRGRALFFVDTCFAGNALGSTIQASRELARLANNLAASENGVVVFASSSGRQQSEEKDEWGNGAFTKALIEGIAGKADFRNEGNITFKGLDFFVSEEVRKLTDGRQTPVTISPIGVPDFVIARL